jgi:hypothetical protein
VEELREAAGSLELGAGSKKAVSEI